MAAADAGRISLVSFHVRDRDQEQVIAAVRFCRLAPAWVSPLIGPWVSVFPSDAEPPEPAVLNRAGEGLSRVLDTHVIGFLLEERRSLLYTVFNGGRIVAEYDSFPEMSGVRGGGYRRETSGRPELLAGLCPGPADGTAMERVLFRRPLAEAVREVMAEEKVESESELWTLLPEDYLMSRIMEKRGFATEEERLSELAALLGISCALFSFGMLERPFQTGGKGLAPDEEKWRRVGA